MSGTTAIKVTWPAATAACGGSQPSSYDVQRSTDGVTFAIAPGGAGVAASPFSDSSVTNGLAYYYRYLPYCAPGAPSALSAKSYPPVVPGVQPLAPSGLVADATSSTTVALSWIAVPDATSYKIYRGPSSGSLSAIGTSGGPASADSPGTGTFFYAVAAVNDSGVESAPSNVVSAALALAAPAGLAASTAPGAITLAWNASAGAVTYSVKRSNSSSGPYGLVASGIPSSQLSYVDASAVAGTTYWYVAVANDASGSPSPDSAPASATAIAGMSLEVPIELADQPLASNATSTVFASTQTSFDSTAYDGSPTYAFEVVATNSDAQAWQATLLNAAGGTLAAISVPAATASPSRQRAAFALSAPPIALAVRLDGTTAPGQLQVLSARLLVQQVNATITKLYFPLLSSAAAPTGADAAAPIATTSSGSLATPATAAIFIHDPTKFATVPAYGAWELEAVVGASGGASAEFGLINVTQGTLVQNTQTISPSAAPTLVDVPIDEGVAGFGAANIGDSAQAAIACPLGCAAGAGSAMIYKAGLWIRLTELTKAEASYRCSPAATAGSLANADWERTLLDLASFSNPAASFVASAVGVGAGATIGLMNAGSSDSGYSGLAPVAGSTLVIPSGAAGSFSTVASPPLTVSSGIRVFPQISPGASATAQVLSCAIVVDAHL
jgi:hypothetical protein